MIPTILYALADKITFPRIRGGDPEATSYITNAIFTVKRTIGKGQNSTEFINYYAEDGAAYVNMKKRTIRTAFKCTEYDPKTIAAVEAAKNAR